VQELVAIAKRHGLPMPPQDAQLVLVASKQTSGHVPAFLLEERNDGSALLLIGGDEFVIDPRDHSLPDWPPFTVATYNSLQDVQPGGYLSLLCVLQVANRGSNVQVEELVQRVADWDLWRDFNTGEMPGLRDLVAESLYEYHEQRIVTHPQQWPDTLEHMEGLLAEFPKIAYESRRGLIRELAAAVHAKPAAPSSTEALLLDWSKRSCETNSFEIYYEELRGDVNEPAREIVLRGKAAIPELIALCGDPRISARRDGQHYILRVGQLAQFLLEQMTTVSRHADEHPTTVANWLAWWQKEGNVDERTFFMSRVFSRWEGRIIEVHDAPARVLAEKYPEAMPQLCNEFRQLAESHVSPFTLTEALALSRLPGPRRLQLLEEFVWRGSLGQRYFALRQLAAVNRERCDELVLRLLEKTSDDATLLYWNRPEAASLLVVAELDEPQVWRAYQRIAQRSHVSLRLQMLSLGWSGTEENRPLRLALLAGFLDDDAVHIRGEAGYQIEGSTAAFDFPEIAVRDFAAWQIANILGLPDNPDPSWSAEQWSGLREQVRQRLNEEKSAVAR
jgi:hypothetical protein